MTFAELVAAARTCRRFQGAAALGADTLVNLVDTARLCPSARNAQPLRYAVVSEAEAKEEVFSMLMMGGSLLPNQRASATQHPGGYIVILGPMDLAGFGLMDVGIAAQTINLAAASTGLSCCMIGAFNTPGLIEILKTPRDLEPKLVLALGTADEERRLTGARPDGSLGYFRDEKDVHWVPKRALEEIIVARL